MGEEFRIKTEVFEGPLELLLNLIEKRKLHISDISLATVTDDFLSHLNQVDDISISKSANFIWVASTLLLIKSRSLLPNLSLTDEEENDIQDLELRLKLYKLFKELTPNILHTFGEHMLFQRRAPTKVDPIFSPDKNCTTLGLYAHITAVIKNLPKKEYATEVLVQKVISLEEVIEELSERIASNLSLSFRDFSKQKESGGQEEKISIIVGFLAMLELVKRGALNVKQETEFGDITMESDNVGLPRYN